MKTNPNEPSIPFDAYIGLDGELSHRNTSETLNRRFYGLTKREHFAGLAMQGILASDWGKKQTSDSKCNIMISQVVNAAVMMADALISELNK